MGQEVAKDYTLITVNQNLQRVKWGGNHDVLKDMRGIHLALKAVHNANRDFKKANPNI